MRYSSCVTDTPLKLLVTVLDDRSVSRCRAMCCLRDLVLLRSNSVQPLLAFQCIRSNSTIAWSYHRYLCLHMKPKQPCPSTSQQTLFGYVTFARCSAPS